MCRAIIAVLVCGGTVISAASDARVDSTKFVVGFDDFSKLAIAEQRAIIKVAFERRLDVLSNLDVRCIQTGSVREYRKSEMGSVLHRLNGARYRCRTHGTSYRLDWELGGPDVLRPNEFEQTTYDSRSGVATSLHQQNGLPYPFARIDSKHNAYKGCLRYTYWLDGISEPTDAGNYLYRDIVQMIESSSVDCDSQLRRVRLQIPWIPPWGGSPDLGTRTLILDPQRAFAPLEGTGYWEMEREDGPMWREEEFRVGAFKLVKDIWLPTQVTETIRASSANHSKTEGLVEYWETEVSEIESGNVTEEQLIVTIPKGTRVADMLKGVVYFLGEDGKPKREQPMLGIDAINTALNPPNRAVKSSRGWLLLAINVVCIAGLVGVALVGTRRHRLH